MNKIRCEKGHYYDADKYTTCPHCNKKKDTYDVNSRLNDEPADSREDGKSFSGATEKTWFVDTSSQKKTYDSNETLAIQINNISESSGEKTESFFSSMSNSERKGQKSPIQTDPQSIQNRSVSERNEERTQSYFDGSNNSNMTGYKQPVESKSKEDKGKTQRFFSDCDNSSNIVGFIPVEPVQPEEDEGKTQSFFSNSDNSENIVGFIPVEPVPQPEENGGKTQSFFNSSTELPLQDIVKKPDITNKTEYIYTQQIYHPEPIVGWIVCIKGERFGECFAINAGKNSIGRNDNNRIVIARDNRISREQHAFIIYEPKSRSFYLQPGNSSGLTYLNKQIVLVPTELKERDEIGLNESRFIFIPLCNASFSWDAIEE